MSDRPATLGELKTTRWADPGLVNRSVKDELRANLISALEKGEHLFPGVLGYEETVVPQLVNAILSRHNLILLGLRGQAKSRILRSLAGLLDPEIPALAGTELNDHPFRPISAEGRRVIAERGDRAAIIWLTRDQRYVEKLATPDVTVADIIGDVDPIKAARVGTNLSDELTVHYGLLPRANRGIFAINELPDLAGKIQVALFNIMQEGDVQIKGYPVRLNLDVFLVFSANPEDYTARGKIVTPLKDRIGSEIRTHYPLTLEKGMEITWQEAWASARHPGDRLVVPDFIAEVVETVAFQAREDQRIDKQSGVSQRVPITLLENAVSNAERRAILDGETTIVPRIADIYAALPAITGKFELEYEGELRGAETVAKEIIKAAVGQVFARRLGSLDLEATLKYFDEGGMLKLTDTLSAEKALAALQKVPGLIAGAGRLGVTKDDDPALRASAAEFILEGLVGRKKISRSEELGYAGVDDELLQDAGERPIRRRFN